MRSVILRSVVPRVVLLHALALSLAGCNVEETLHAMVAGQNANAAAQPGEQLALAEHWTCPMHAHVVQDHPGSCPICGMDLVETSPAGGHEAGVVVDTATRQRMGVRLATAELRRISRPLSTYGTVAVDPRNALEVTSKTEGWIVKLHVGAVGERVRAGQALYEVYSPTLIQKQREYLRQDERRRQLRNSVASQPDTYKDILANIEREGALARRQLALDGLDEALLREIETRNDALEFVPIRAQQDGIVLEIATQPGAAVGVSDPILRLADIARVWVDVTLYEDQLDWLRGNEAVQLRAAKGGRWSGEGRLEFVSHVIDTATRTLRGRVMVDNDQELLRPGMLLDVTIQTNSHEALVVPRSALLRSGRSEHVMVHHGDGRFVPTPVVAGVETGEWVEIVEGIAPAASVAVNGQFLLDSAAALADTWQRAQIADGAAGAM
jgi:Cu(I)/Ag(I) efflux system membrane fusion protein